MMIQMETILRELNNHSNVRFSKCFATKKQKAVPDKETQRKNVFRKKHVRKVILEGNYGQSAYLNSLGHIFVWDYNKGEEVYDISPIGIKEWDTIKYYTKGLDSDIYRAIDNFIKTQK